MIVIGSAMLALAASSSVQAQNTNYHGRKAWMLRNNRLTVVVTPGGGHIASMTLNSGRGSNLNPFWLPPWQSVEPGVWRSDPAKYGKPAAQLLSCILGHNICVDFFGAPSAPETAPGCRYTARLHAWTGERPRAGAGSLAIQRSFRSQT